MSHWQIRRRQLITAAGAVLSIPLLESLLPRSRSALAANGSDPRRFVSLYMPNGTYNRVEDPVWYPSTGGPNNQGGYPTLGSGRTVLAPGPLTVATLPLVWQPFAANIGDFSILMRPASKVREQAAALAPNGGGHVSAVTTWLSQVSFTDFNANNCTVPGSSFDQMYADTSGKALMVMSAGCNGGNPDGVAFNYSDYVSYNNGQPNEPHKNPVELFTSMFASLMPTPSAPQTAAARNHSILDSSLADIAELKSKLGKSDNIKLDDYFTSLRDLETQLYSMPAATNGCMPGTAPPETLDNVDIDGSMSDVYIQRVQAFFDMIVLAFKCDIARSVSFMFDGESASRPNNQCPPAMVFDNASLTGALHIGISHYGTTSDGPAKCISRDRNYMSLFTYLLNGLKAATDPSGSSILDNTIVLTGYGVTDGNHDDDEAGVPLVAGGGKNLGLHPGNCLDLNNADMIDLYYTFSTFLGMGLANFRGSSNVLTTV